MYQSMYYIICVCICIRCGALCTLTPPGEYGGSIFAAAAMRLYAAITVATCYGLLITADVKYVTGLDNSF